LTPTPLTLVTVERFGRALLGWIGYAPLLLRLRTPDEDWYRVGIALMREAVVEAAPILATGLKWDGFLAAPSLLARDSRRSEHDLEELRSTEEAWRSWLGERRSSSRMPRGTQTVQRAA